MIEKCHLFQGNFLLTAEIANVSVSYISNNTDVGQDMSSQLADLTLMIGADFNNSMGVPWGQRGQS